MFNASAGSSAVDFDLLAALASLAAFLACLAVSFSRRFSSGVLLCDGGVAGSALAVAFGVGLAAALKGTTNLRSTSHFLPNESVSPSVVSWPETRPSADSKSFMLMLPLELNAGLSAECATSQLMIWPLSLTV